MTHAREPRLISVEERASLPAFRSFPHSSALSRLQWIPGRAPGEPGSSGSCTPCFCSRWSSRSQGAHGGCGPWPTLSPGGKTATDSGALDLRLLHLRRVVDQELG